MKMASIVAAGLGVLALVLAIIDRLLSTLIMGVLARGYLALATALFLLALVIMAYDRCYGCTKPPPSSQ